MFKILKKQNKPSVVSSTNKVIVLTLYFDGSFSIFLTKINSVGNFSSQSLTCICFESKQVQRKALGCHMTI